MDNVISLPYKNGKTILIQVNGPITTGEIQELTNRHETEPIVAVSQNLETVSTTIVEISQVMVGAFEKVASGSSQTRKERDPLVPTKATLEFGVNFTAEGCIYIAKATLEAALKVSIEWDFSKENSNE